MEIVQHKQYQSGDLVVSPATRGLSVRGVPQHLRPKTFELLLYLMEHRHRLVGREELLDQVWKDVSVTEKSITQCVIELRKCLGDDARNPRYIKTVAKVGYQFIGPVDGQVPNPPSALVLESSSSVELEEVTTTQVDIVTTDGRTGGRRWVAVAALAALATVLLVALRWSSAQPETVLPEIVGRRPVVVMYFENQSHSPELDWLSAGLADMVITNLSRSGKLTMLSRQQLASSLQRFGKKTPFQLQDAMEIATRSHASAMILGSFSKLGERVRIAAQVHDTRTGRLLGAESVTADRPEQILTTIDTLSLELARHLGAPVPMPYRKSGLGTLMTSNLEAYRYYSLGIEKAHSFDDAQAVELFQKALALDADFVMAQARIGYTLAVMGLEPEQGRNYLEKAFQRSRRLTDSDRLHIAAWYAVANRDFSDAVRRYRELLANDPAEIESYMRLGRLLRGERRYDEAIEVLKQGLALDPDSVEILNPLGAVYSQLGRHADAIEREQRYVALAPAEANAYDSLGLAYAWAGRIAEAESAYLRALELRPGFDIARRHLSWLCFQTGRYRAGSREGERTIQSAAPGRMRALAKASHAWALTGIGWLEPARQLAREAARAEPGLDVEAMVAVKTGELPLATAVATTMQTPSWGNRGERQSSIERERHYLLGSVALASNQPAEAIGQFQESLRYWALWSTPAWLEDCLADAYLRLGRWDEAIAEYQRILALFPGIGQARYHLAVAYRRKGQMKQAKAEFQRFLDLWNQADPDVPEIVDARAEVQRIP